MRPIPYIFPGLLAVGLWLGAQQSTSEKRPAIGQEHYRIYHGNGRPATLSELVSCPR